VNDKTILEHIHDLVAEEKELRESHAGRGLPAEKRQRLQHLEEELDQAWDLLRQRRAREETGEDPDAVHERSINEVEGYLQ
jgi:hypothetical protein